MLSLSNTNENSTILSTPVVLLTLLFITLIRIYTLFVSPIELSVDEAQYWHWSQNLDFGYFTKPPFIAWIIALSTNLFGNE
jgi:4-amino-4-deoxy-L-arabinose transferase-like glycosyltransferase